MRAQSLLTLFDPMNLIGLDKYHGEGITLVNDYPLKLLKCEK